LSLPPLPSLDEIKDADEEFWRWVFRTNDSGNHPLKISNRGKAQTQSGRILILAGALSGEPKPMQRDRRLEIAKGIDYIFVPADNCVYTKADGDGVAEQTLVDNANRDNSSGTGNVQLNGNSLALNLLPGHPFSPQLDIQKRIKGSGKSKNGEGWTNNTPPRNTIAASACHYAIIHAKTLRINDTIRITGEAGTGIDVTYTVTSTVRSK
jgi:hypothetical protein